MEFKSIKVKLIGQKANKVTVDFVAQEHGPVEMSKRNFEKRLEVGHYQLVNPEVIPPVI